MKPLFLAFLGGVLALTGCTYNVVQQQNGQRKGSQSVVIGGGDRPAITAYQGTGSFPSYSGSTYPEYNGYPGSGNRSGYYYHPRPYNGYYGGPIGPAYPPDDGGIPYPLPLHNDLPAFHSELTLY